MARISDIGSIIGTGSGAGLGALTASLMGYNPLIGGVIGAPLGAIGGSKLGKWYAEHNQRPKNHVRLYAGDINNPKYMSKSPIIESSIFEDLNSDDIQYTFVPMKGQW